MGIELWAPLITAAGGALGALGLSSKYAIRALVDYKLAQAEHERDMQLRKFEHELEMQKMRDERTERMVAHMATNTEAMRDLREGFRQQTAVITDLSTVVAGLAERFESGGRPHDTS
jgi:hypothetical protein